MESIIKTLVRNDLLTGLRGKGGGYKLTKSPNLYTAGEILRVSEENFAPIESLIEIDYNDPSEVKTLKLFKGLDETINAYLNRISLSDLLVEESGDIYFI